MNLEEMKQVWEALHCIESPLEVREIVKVGKAMGIMRKAIAEAERQSASTNGEAGTEKCPPGGGGYPGIKSSRLIVEGNK